MLIPMLIPVKPFARLSIEVGERSTFLKRSTTRKSRSASTSVLIVLSAVAYPCRPPAGSAYEPHWPVRAVRFATHDAHRTSGGRRLVDRTAK